MFKIYKSPVTELEQPQIEQVLPSHFIAFQNISSVPFYVGPVFGDLASFLWNVHVYVSQKWSRETAA